MRSVHSSANASSQCKAQFKAEALAAKIAPSFNCGDFNNYACERRVFSPDVESMVHLLKECVSGGEICVDVEVREISTAAAKLFEPPEMFVPHATYNREEVRCRHKYTYKNSAIFEGEGDSMELALAEAMHSCEQASEGL